MPAYPVLVRRWTEEEVRLALAVAIGIERLTAERRIPGSSCRYDLGVHRADGELVGLIEVKRSGRRRPLCLGRQGSAYGGACLPWRYCHGMADVPATAAWALELAQR